MKPTLALPIYYDSKTVMTPSHLPPSPSTSSSINAYMDEDMKGKRPFVNTYGSMGSNAPYLDISRPITPSQTTVSPNENDGGLYLLWAEELLRKSRGYEPSTIHNGEESDSSLSSSDEEEEEEEVKDVYIQLLRSSTTTTYQSPPSVAISSHNNDTTTSNSISIVTQLFKNCFALCLSANHAPDQNH